MTSTSTSTEFVPLMEVEGSADGGEPALTAEELDCPVMTASDDQLHEDLEYWVEGVILVIVAAFGVFGNFLASLILGRQAMRNSFNMLLIALALVDATYLVGSILKSMRERFKVISYAHIVLVPTFLHPLQSIAMTASILLTVAIALERFVAVHYPMRYRDAMNDPSALRCRVASYLVPVFAITLLFNVTKFFELELSFPPPSPTPGAVEPDGPGVSIDVTQFRKDPRYAISFNWFRFISNGIVPLILLAIFNAQIYHDIRKRRIAKTAKSSHVRNGIPRNGGRGAARGSERALIAPEPSTTVICTRTNPGATLDCGRDPVTKSRRRRIAILATKQANGGGDDAEQATVGTSGGDQVNQIAAEPDDDETALMLQVESGSPNKQPNGGSVNLEDSPKGNLKSGKSK